MERVSNLTRVTQLVRVELGREIRFSGFLISSLVLLADYIERCTLVKKKKKRRNMEVESYTKIRKINLKSFSQCPHFPDEEVRLGNLM